MPTPSMRSPLKSGLSGYWSCVHASTNALALAEGFLMSEMVMGPPCPR